MGFQEWGSKAEDCSSGDAGHALPHQGPLSSRVRLPVGSDNQGNVMAMLNLGSKKPYTAAILMELVFLLHTHGCSLAANHVPREFNQWADELTHPDFSGFDPLQRVPKQELCEEFVFLPRLLNGDERGPTHAPVTGAGG